MPVLYALCGVAFAGKSTIARQVAAELRAGLVSLDAIHTERGLDPGADLAPETWAETARIALGQTGALLDQRRSVVVDDTFSYRFQRDRFRDLASRKGSGFLILFVDTPDAVTRARVEANRRDPVRPDVLPHVVEFIRAEFQPPRDDEPFVRFAAPEDVERWLRETR